MESITIHLSDPVYQRVKQTADTMSLSLEAVITEAVSLLLPSFERDIPPVWQEDLASLALLSDTQLWKIAHQQMDAVHQLHLEQLAEMQKQQPLSPARQHELEELMQEAQHLMLSKAEAARLLAQRGHQVFSKS
jgi:hypothetical protein